MRECERARVNRSIQDQNLCMIISFIFDRHSQTYHPIRNNNKITHRAIFFFFFFESLRLLWEHERENDKNKYVSRREDLTCLK